MVKDSSSLLYRPELVASRLLVPLQQHDDSAFNLVSSGGTELFPFLWHIHTVP